MWAHLVNVLLVGMLISYSVVVYGSLPDRIPAHFDISGEPDRWVETTWGSWLLLPAIAAGVTIFFYLIGLLVRRLGARHPRWINVPAKKAFLKLEPSQREQVMREVAALLHWFVVPLNALMLYSQWVTARIALGELSRLPGAVLFAVLVGVPIIVVVYVIRIRRQILAFR